VKRAKCKWEVYNGCVTSGTHLDCNNKNCLSYFPQVYRLIKHANRRNEVVETGVDYEDI
jgi:hypothetical protein